MIPKLWLGQMPSLHPSPPVPTINDRVCILFGGSPIFCCYTSHGLILGVFLNVLRPLLCLPL